MYCMMTACHIFVFTIWWAHIFLPTTPVFHSIRQLSRIVICVWNLRHLLCQFFTVTPQTSWRLKSPPTRLFVYKNQYCKQHFYVSISVTSNGHHHVWIKRRLDCLINSLRSLTKKTLCDGNTVIAGGSHSQWTSNVERVFCPCYDVAYVSLISYNLD